MIEWLEKIEKKKVMAKKSKVNPLRDTFHLF